MRQCVVKNIEGSAGRWLEVAPARFPGWIASFAERHGGAAPGAALTVALSGENVIYTAPDGAVARCHPPFPPVPDPGAPSETGTAGAPAAYAEAIAAHATAPRTVGVLLVRLGGYAAGVFTGSPPELTASKAGSRLVHGRSAAGGWSQHRFARRREKQVAEALQAAADAAVAVFGQWQGSLSDNSKRRPTGRQGLGEDNSKRRAAGLDAVVLGGDKRAIAELREDPRLAPYLELATERFLTVPDPKLAVLKDTPRLFLAVRIMLTEPAT
jgi:Actinobacteria/chloroflexi VLRF1 release factor